MDAPPERPSADPSDETDFRSAKPGETILSNSLESKMEPPWQEGSTVGDFHIGKLLGRGRAGFVYSAIDLLAHRRCAVKVLCRMSSHDLVRNKLGFRKMAPFRHPCLMRTDRIHLIEGLNVLSMEEIEGETLYAALRRFSEQPRGIVYQKLHTLLHDYAVGLAIMHFAGLVHRDIKPTNLMVRENGHGAIVDYGLVTNLDPENDPNGIRPYIAGTPRYFSPEALWDQSYIPAGDVFSLGLVMLDCLNKVSGSDRWLRRGNFEDWIRDEDQQSISDAVSGLGDDIPSVLRMAVAGMLSGDKSKRPSSLDLVEMTKTDDSPIRLVSDYHVFGRESEIDECNDWIRDIYRGATGRLHIYGEAGAGKTRLLDELERQLKQNQWGQVFRVKCRSRENETIQVMDQICDQIASRYSRRDRESLRLDQVSYSILAKTYPQLRHVIEADLRDVPDSFAGEPEREDALAAAKRLSRELRKIGPLIIIIDDAQWSDRDSDSVWDELQKDTEGYLGLITSSRVPETNQRHRADKRLHVGPLSKESALAYLQNAAQRWQANVNKAALAELVEISRCNAFRLHELVEELRPGGMLHRVQQSDDAGISNLGDIDRLWKVRFDRLHENDKAVLSFIVTADAPVSISQLAELTAFENIDESVSKLVEQRLVNDDATGTECITIVHDKIADGLIENLSDHKLKEAHLQWAQLLSQLDRPRDFAARIASHYYTAGDNGAALPYAIRAAENADRAFAKSEAGSWHEKVLEQVVGAAHDKHLRDAARCYFEADLPEKAAGLFLRLSSETNCESEKLEFQTRAVQLLVRSGQMDRAKPLIESLSARLNVQTQMPGKELPDENPARLAEIAEALCRIEPSCDSNSEALEREAAKEEPDDSDVPSNPSLSQSQLQFCTAIGRPMSMFDLQLALQLVVHGGERAEANGDLASRAHFGAMASVWQSVASGDSVRVLDQSRDRLVRMVRHAEAAEDRMAIAEIWSGIAYLETLAMRWSHVPYAVDTSIQHYGQRSEPLRFEIAHTRWLSFWSDWNLGRWDSMRSNAMEMVADAGRRNDYYQQLVATSGYGGNVFLFADDVERARTLTSQNRRIRTSRQSVQFADFFIWMQDVQQRIYLGEFETARESILRMRSEINSSMLDQIPLIKATLDFFTTLTALHLQQSAVVDSSDGAARELPAEWLADVRQGIEGLGMLDNGYSNTLMQLFTGIQNRIQGKTDDAMGQFVLAAESASEFGLFPFQLAAEDALLNLSKPGADADSLRHQMTNQRIAQPECLERLYTVAPPKCSGDVEQDSSLPTEQ